LPHPSAIPRKRRTIGATLQRTCDYLDSEIDRLVYALYGLTAEEIRIVEGDNMASFPDCRAGSADPQPS
jgi:hypothetical protein